jgi:hypothetical protein
MIRYSETYGFESTRPLTDPLEIAAQKAFIRFRTHKGEWLLDSRAGHPWQYWFSVKPTPLDAIRDALTLDLSRISEVQSVLSASVTKSPSASTITAVFEVRIQDSLDPQRLRFVASPFEPFRFSLEPL